MDIAVWFSVVFPTFRRNPDDGVPGTGTPDSPRRAWVPDVTIRRHPSYIICAILQHLS